MSASRSCASASPPPAERLAPLPFFPRFLKAFPMRSFRLALLTGASLAAAVMVLPALVADARAQSRAVTVSEAGQTLTLAAGKSAIVDLPRDATEIFVGNPKVANAVVRTPRRLFVMGVENGQTSIYALDKDGNRFLNLDLRVGRDVGELNQILRSAMPNSKVYAKTVNDSIILLGEADSALEAQKAYDIASAFVGWSTAGGGTASGQGSISFGTTQVVTGNLINSITIRGRDQVMVKVTVAEVRRSVLKQLGVNTSGNWSSKIGALNTGGDFTNLSSVGPNSVATIGGIGKSVEATLNALERNGVARVLAEPTVTATSGEAAKFVAGGQTQVATNSQASAAGCTVQYALKPYGVSLSMTPIVLSEGRIQLHISTEVTEVDAVRAVNVKSCSGLPGMRTRANSTTVELPSGGSVVSAGLIQQRSEQTFMGQPGLMSLPILGTLFRSREYQREETELMIIMTPYIAKMVSPDKLARPDDGFVDPSDGQAIFLGRMNRIYSTRSNPQNLQILKGRVGFIND